MFLPNIFLSNILKVHVMASARKQASGEYYLIYCLSGVLTSNLGQD
jgi:hypothetical protein